MDQALVYNRILVLDYGYNTLADCKRQWNIVKLMISMTFFFFLNFIILLALAFLEIGKYLIKLIFDVNSRLRVLPLAPKFLDLLHLLALPNFVPSFSLALV